MSQQFNIEHLTFLKVPEETVMKYATKHFSPYLNTGFNIYIDQKQNNTDQSRDSLKQATIAPLLTRSSLATRRIASVDNRSLNYAPHVLDTQPALRNI